MEKREPVKSMEEYAKALAEVAPEEVVQEYVRLFEEGKRIKAIQLLRQYMVIKPSDR